MQWHRAPLLRLLPPFIAGVIWAMYLPVNVGLLLILLAISLCCLLLLFFVRKEKQAQLSLSVIPALVNNIALIFIGAIAVCFNSPTSKNQQLNTQNQLLVKVISSPQEKANSFGIEVTAQYAYADSILKKTSGKIILYLSKSGYDSTISYGDYLWVNKPPQPTKPPPNPAEFDYSQWLALKNVYHTAFLKQSEYSKTTLHGGNVLFTFSYKARDYFNTILQRYLSDSSAYGVAAALVLGLRDQVDDDLTDAYARSGTIHILAVSGLHVGAIYLLLVFITAFIPKKKWFLVARLLLFILGLWFYALLTGLSPSVVRATVMFSFIAIGDAMGRKTNLFNSLVGAALLTLCIDPKAIFTVGFQLSYLAVAGIGLLYAPIHNLLSPKTWALRKVWQLLCVSFAAQLATFPLAVYYFHQFPNYFLLSNLLIVPLGMVGVYLGLLLFVVSPVPVLASFVGKVLVFVLHVANYSAQSIEGLPFSYSSGLYFSKVAVVIVYGLIISVFLYLKTKKYLPLALGIICCIGLAILHLERNYRTAQIDQFTVYSLPNGNTAFSYIKSNTAVVYTDSLLTTESKTYRQKITPHLLECNVDEIENIHSLTFNGNNFSINNKGFIALHEKNILWLSEASQLNTMTNTQWDVVIVDGNPKISLKRLSESITCKQVVLTVNNKAYNLKKWVEEAKQFDSNVYDMTSRGAYQLNFIPHE